MTLDDPRGPVWYDETGLAWYDRAAVWPPEAEAMHQPVRCAFCHGVYDLGTVEVTARYTDCSMWKTPCCGITADDRGETGWKSRKDYTRLVRPGATRP